jgi:hypothetical protein
MTATSVTNAAGQLVLDGLYGPKLVTDGFGPPAGSRWAGRGMAITLDRFGNVATGQIKTCYQGDNFYLTITQQPPFLGPLGTRVLTVMATPTSPPLLVCSARAVPDGSTPAGYSVTWILTASQTSLLAPGYWYWRATVATIWGDTLTPEDLTIYVARPDGGLAQGQVLARGVPAQVQITQYNADGSLYDITGMSLVWTTSGAGTLTKQQAAGEILPVGPGTVQVPLTDVETGSLTPNTLLYGTMTDTVSALSWTTAPVQVGS